VGPDGQWLGGFISSTITTRGHWGCSQWELACRDFRGEDVGLPMRWWYMMAVGFVILEEHHTYLFIYSP